MSDYANSFSICLRLLVFVRKFLSTFHSSKPVEFLDERAFPIPLGDCTYVFHKFGDVVLSQCPSEVFGCLFE